MAHRNREKRAAKKARAAERNQEIYDEEFGDEYDEEDYYDEEDEPRRRRGPHPALIAFIVTVAIVAGGFYWLNSAYDRAISPVDPGNYAEVTIEIPEGASTTTIASILNHYGLISNELFFRIHSKRMGFDEKYKHGVFTLNRSMDVNEIANVIIKGTLANTKRFTIPEGYNTVQIAAALQEQGIITEAEFYEEVRNGVFDYLFLADVPLGDKRLEGFLYPETYEVFDDASAHDVINIMLHQFDQLFHPEYYTRAEDMGMSVREVVTLASIVERESVVAEERPIMARVFLNRLEQDMLLESCATIQYILGEPKEYLTIADTQIESPYNTYLHRGLPPGPICNPRIASIQAVLFPDNNDYLFFVLSPALDGSHRFSADYNEFLQNKDEYYAAVGG